MESVAAINKAAFEGKSEELFDLLSQYQEQHPSTAIDNLIDIDDASRGPLHFAVLGKQVEVVRVLLERFNCSPFVLDSDAWSPLHVAASVGSAEIIELLINCAADRSTSLGTQADSVTVYCNQPTRLSKQFPLHLAAAKGHEEAVIRLICHGAKASLRNSSGQTPLHRAACAGKPLVVAALLQSDSAIINLKDFSEEGNTALHLAAQDGHFDVVRLLKEIGEADVDIQNSQGKTPAQVAQNAEIRDYLNQK